VKATWDMGRVAMLDTLTGLSGLIEKVYPYPIVRAAAVKSSTAGATMTIIHIVLFKISSSLDQSGILKVNKTNRAILSSL
jgi:hypothetical protein